MELEEGPLVEMWVAFSLDGSDVLVRCGGEVRLGKEGALWVGRSRNDGSSGDTGTYSHALRPAS